MRNRDVQNGNALFIILLCIVLFGALTWAVTQGWRGTQSQLGAEKIQALAADVVLSASDVEKSVQKLIERGISESRLSFTKDGADSYVLSPVQTSAERVFHLSGGGAQWLTPPADALDTTLSAQTAYGTWIYTSGNRVQDIGLDNADVASVDLVAILPYVRRDICIAINNKVGVTNTGGVPPSDTGQVDLASRFTGTFANTAQINGTELTGHKTGCFQGNQDQSGSSITGRYYFYYTILAR